MLATSTSTLDFSTITNALTNSVSTADVMQVIATGIGIAMGFVLIWWGSRKLMRMVMAAFKSGKLKF